MNDEMNNAMDELFNAINEDYVRWATVAFAKSELTSDPSPDWTLEAKPGRSYIKIIKNEGPNRGSVWGFVVKKDSAKFKEGDILMAASYNAPATNKPRGNILEGGYDVEWTGPKYL
jgi:hypothetical protein